MSDDGLTKRTATASGVLVCGDLVWDTYIARMTSPALGHSQPRAQSQIEHHYGGAWYLRDLLAEATAAARREMEELLSKRRKFLADAPLENERPPSAELLESLNKAIEQAQGWANLLRTKIDAPTKLDPTLFANDDSSRDERIGGVGRAVSVWQWFDGKEAPAKVKLDGQHLKTTTQATPGAWRIHEFLGCQNPSWEAEREFASLADEEPSILVIDDLGLGFVAHRECWPNCLVDPERFPTTVIVKATPPFTTALWETLLVSPLAERTTVVLSAEALRDHGARLSRGLSWDQTIEDVENEIREGGTCWPLRHASRLVITFGRSGAVVFSRTPLRPNETPERLQFERFVYDPLHLEGTWEGGSKGMMFGTASAMTAMLAVDALAFPERSKHIAVSRGLAAARALYEHGHGHDQNQFSEGKAKVGPFDVEATALPERTFRSAFPRDLLDRPRIEASRVPGPSDQTLLTDVVGITPSFLTVVAEDIVRFGQKRALQGVPRVEYGKFFTVDRQEIERLNSVRNLILDYCDNPADARPLSIAVVGQPGSGKSFAIKQLAAHLFGSARKPLEFNLSQFRTVGDLQEAFHQVRDESVAGTIPLVFWDEFDSQHDGDLGWLKEFLAPMQDFQFVANGKAHPFGKCIFIFAGGTAKTFAEFDRSRDTRDEDFGMCKGPDFVSRLRGYVDIKGPNSTGSGDGVHVVRRALLLRSLIERYHGHLVQPGGDEIDVHPSVLDAFLHVGDDSGGYLHGARSMEAIVSLSRLRGCRRFGPADLPPSEVIGLHATSDFARKVGRRLTYQFSSADFEAIAKLVHTKWLEQKKGSGYVRGAIRDDDAKVHPGLRPYDDLGEPEKENNRLPARLTALRLSGLGYEVQIPYSDSRWPGEELGQEQVAKLSISEHRRWMREKLLDGMHYAPTSDDTLLLHRNVCKWQDLPEKDQYLDHAIIDAICDFLRERKLRLVQRPKNPY